ncbi:Uu.00g065660.m01.CDS01 [Anthostomella pinea]|uniref:Uu.00g065660.m01.CDS01 n=1 Tax=Anthostomella pinea TaxID=933095 RepID=A0AAI8YNB7_9PEZI|nr:Uu.00g065660.m01.CDS01 [Anthostomella pinea]
MRNGLSATLTAASLSSRAYTARLCGNTTAPSSTYQWRVGDARYDGADPSKTDGLATVALSVVPEDTSSNAAFFECVAEWPEAWAGWYEDSNIIWSDCIWAGNGPTYDTAIAFAVDWNNRTLFVSHTFGCSDRSGSDALAIGAAHLDMDCADVDGSSNCILPTSLNVTTQAAPARLQTNPTCTDNSARYQSWQLENWTRQYEMVPGSSAITPQSDTGTSFTLRNMVNSDMFNCSPSGDQNDTFVGTCTPATGGSPTTTATFRFEPLRGMLSITQQWSCSDSPSFDAVGVSYVQATCAREGNMLNFTSDPLWIGTKTV